MIQSMTGYGKATCDLENKKVTIEIKSLNNKQLDINFKVPFLYREKEPELRNNITKQLQRGKVDVFIYQEVLQSENVTKINPDIVKDYYEQIYNIAYDLNLKLSEQIFSSIIRLPDSLKTESQEMDEKEWAVINKCFSEAIKNLKEHRQQEGAVLEKDIIKRVKQILNYLTGIKKFEKNRIDNIKSKIVKGLETSDDINIEFDKNRLEQELIYYIEKIDITEEKVRLKNHCDYFLENIQSKDSIGKKLGFITQEIGREINTIGSKANDFNIQKLVVQMKDELEKVKEQIMNIQ